jgi:predicted Holliday junction resolvase-like endonuclease
MLLDMTNWPTPTNFIELVATVFALFSLFFATASVWRGQQTVRLFALVLVASLSLYANSAAVYFAAVFIVATAVTELAFLEKLAAIIRGNKEYFDYQKELLSVKESQERALEEIVSDDEERENTTPHIQKSDAVVSGYAIEQLALSYIEKRLAEPLERNVRFSGRSGSVAVEFDGVAQRGGGRPDVLVEVKLLGSRSLEEAARLFGKRALLIQDRYQKITGRRSTVRLLIVVPDRREVGPKIPEISRVVRELGHTLQLDVADFEEIGYYPPRTES